MCVGTRGRSAAGYLRDVGLAYGDQGNGWSYGWVVPEPPLPESLGNGADRNGTNKDVRLDTLVHMQGLRTASLPAPGKWRSATASTTSRSA